jgi:hypothetical protein
MPFSMQSANSGVFLPIVKWNAVAGKFFIVNREVGGEQRHIEVPNNTQFAIDFGTLEAGYVSFGQQGPTRTMVPYYEGVSMPGQPQDRDAENRLIMKPGFWIKVAGNALEGVREWCSNASSLLNAMDELYQLYRTSPEAARDQIPIVVIRGTNTIVTGSGARKSTNYAPIFEIISWIQRPAELLGPRTTPIPAAAPAAPPASPAAWTPPPAAPVMPATPPVTPPAPQRPATSPLPSMPF